MAESNKLLLDLPLVSPAIEGARDSGKACLIELLQSHAGSAQAHVIEPDGPAPVLCIHYDPAMLSSSGVRELARAAGAELSAQGPGLKLPR